LYALDFCHAGCCRAAETQDRLFSLTRDKLMKILAFARQYGWYSQAIAWLKATEAWRTLEALARRGREHFKGIAARLAYWIQQAIENRICLALSPALGAGPLYTTRKMG
jgi:hypothetical protein